MKYAIHPEYKTVTAVCSCGHKFEIKSTYKEKELHLDICSKCHPFYTGTQKIIDTEQRVDKFNRKYGQTQKKAEG